MAGESFVGMMHLQRYVYIQQWWYNSRVYARIAALLAVRTAGELFGCLFYFKSAYFLQRSFLVQHGAVDMLLLLLSSH